MSTSAENCLRFVFGTVDSLAIKWRPFTGDQLVRECRGHLAEKPNCPTWQKRILQAMRDVLDEERNRIGLETRLAALIRNGALHPDRDALVTELGRRALLGQLRMSSGDTVNEYPNFAAQLERLYKGGVTHQDLWGQAWQRAAKDLNISTKETL